MPQPFPVHLRTVLKAGKSRSQPAAFKLNEPRRGFAYAQAAGTDTPVFWDVAFRFTQSEAAAFRLWFTQIINRGVDEFTLPLRTEYGLITHTCRFLPESLLPASEDGATWGYTATIMARAEITPDGFADAAELIVGLPDWSLWASLLDETVTDAAPEA